MENLHRFLVMSDRLEGFRKKSSDNIQKIHSDITLKYVEPHPA